MCNSIFNHTNLIIDVEILGELDNTISEQNEATSIAPVTLTDTMAGKEILLLAQRGTERTACLNNVHL